MKSIKRRNNLSTLGPKIYVIRSFLFVREKGGGKGTGWVKMRFGNKGNPK